MAVTRCVCREVPFERIRQLAERLRAQGKPVDLDVIESLTGAGTGCGTCIPYIQIVLDTGQTVLPVLPMPPQTGADEYVDGEK